MVLQWVSLELYSQDPLYSLASETSTPGCSQPLVWIPISIHKTKSLQHLLSYLRKNYGETWLSISFYPFLPYYGYQSQKSTGIVAHLK